MFKKEQVSKMKENEFQNAVLIPLFRAMKFHDVTAFGGGSLELGKDIVMWKEGELGERVNYGVVVKAVRISGKARGSDTASEVLNQIRQCLTSEYPDPVTSQEQKVQRCFVVSSQIIEKSSINSIKTQLQSFHFDKLVTWLHPGTNLFEIIDRYLPEQNVIEKLSSVQKELDEAMKIVPYRIVADSEKKFSIFAKHEKATVEMPFTVKGKFNFDATTEEGKKALEKFKEHFTKGSRVEIGGKFIESFELPDFLPEWLKPQLTKDSKLILEPIRPDIIIPLRFERELDSGEVITLDGLNFEIAQSGTEEITLKNDKQKIPVQVTLTFNSKERIFNFNIVYLFYGFNVFQQLQGLKFFTSMSMDGETDIYRTDIGIKIPNALKGKIKLEENYDRNIELLEALVLIQERIPIVLTYPENPITNEEVEGIFEVAEIIKNGKLNGTSSEIKTDVSLDVAKDYVKNFENEAVNHIVVSYTEGCKFNILGNEINLGVAVISTDVFIAKNDFEEIERNIKANKETIEFCLKPKDSSVIIDFLKWECEDRHTRLEIVEPAI